MSNKAMAAVSANDKRVIGGQTDINQMHPLKYSWAWDMFMKNWRNFWTPEDIPMSADVKDYKFNLTDAERHVYENVLAFISTADIAAARNVGSVLADKITAPELQNFIFAQSGGETIHSWAYQIGIETIGLDPHDIYNRYRVVPELYAKIKYSSDIMAGIDSLPNDLSSDDDLKKFVLGYFFMAGIFEGCWFYNGFSPLFALQRRNLMKGTGEQIQYIARDECLIGETEVLTKSGWVRLDQLDDGVDVLQYNDDGTTEFVTPSRVVRNHYEGDMLHFYNEQGHFEQIVTPNHRMPTFNKNRDIRVVEAVDLKIHRYMFFICAGENGVLSEKTNYLTYKERFAIAFQSDGYLSDRYTGEHCGTLPIIFSFAKSRKCDRIEEILENLGYKYKKSFLAKRGMVKYEVSLPLSDKWVSCKNFEWVRIGEMSSKKAAQFIDEISEWDGCKPSSNRVRFDGARKAASDVICAVATLAGYRVMTRVIADNRSDTFSDIYRNYIVKNRNTIQGGGVKRDVVKHNGMVYCVTVPSGMFVVRYNKSVSVTGNCQHVAFGLKVVNQILKEEQIKIDDAEYHKIVFECERLEEDYSKFIFKNPILGIRQDDYMEQYRFLANRRCGSIGVSDPYPNAENRLTWLDEQANIRKEKNFFETRITDYQKRGLSW